MVEWYPPLLFCIMYVDWIRWEAKKCNLMDFGGRDLQKMAFKSFKLMEDMDVKIKIWAKYYTMKCTHKYACKNVES